MLIQAKSKYWDKKFSNANSPFQRNEVILSSGKERAAARINMNTGETFYRPAVGAFVIWGEKEGDDFIYDNADEAIAHGNKLHAQILAEQSV